MPVTAREATAREMRCAWRGQLREGRGGEGSGRGRSGRMMLVRPFPSFFGGLCVPIGI